MNTKYNILYNGDIALEQGLEELNSKYVDDYWKRLPIEPLKVDELAIPGVKGTVDNSNASFERAEEKAVKAVQKHSMNIAGTEKNSQIDNAYLLLGKSRYYSQRFVPAMEAFNYVIKNYPTADLIHETRIWRAKTLLRINADELALQSLELMLAKEELYEEYIIEDAHTAIAMVYTVMDSTDQVVYHLKKAVRTDYNREQKARNLFILGQIYREQNKIDSSQIAFEQIIEMKKIPYKYQIHSEIEKAKNLSEDTDLLALNKRLTKLINTRENRPYLDELHYQSGIVFEERGLLEPAEFNYNKSAHAPNAKQFQQSLSFEKLGNLSFDKTNFVKAGAYYDSVLRIPQDRNTKRFRRLKRKRENLEEVILYEGVARITDSILNIVSMSEDEQKSFFQAYIDELLIIKEEQDLKAQEYNSGFGGFADDTNNQTSSNGKWYFYNAQLSGFGTQRFRQVWGNRPYEENWRISDKSTLRGNIEPEEELFDVADLDEEEKYKLESYLDRIPTSQKELDSISSARNEAYFNLGLIYKEQFKEYEIASYRFEDLLTFSPETKYILPAKYHLYKIYLELGSPKSETHKDDIVSNYADTKYAKMITNPQAILADDENDPENIYEDVYCEYEAENYEDVLSRSNDAIELYEDLPILPKFELLRAFTIGKLKGVDAFKTALEFVALNYSNTIEGKKAMEVIETINKLE